MRRIFLGLTLALVACGGKKSDAGDGESAHPTSGSCSHVTMTTLRSCTEYAGITADDWTALKGSADTYCMVDSLNFDETWSDGPCTREGAAGGCRRTKPSGMATVDWYYRDYQGSPATEAYAREQCTDGEFVAATLR